MKILPGSLNMVANGDWNRFFFNPPWLAENLFQTDTLSVELLGTNTENLIRFQNDGISIVPSTRQTTIVCMKTSAENIGRFENFCKRFFMVVKSPLIEAYGFNVSFSGMDDSVYPSIVDNIDDNRNLISAGAEIISTDIIRRIKIDEFIYNYTISAIGGKTKFDFNWHIPVNDISDSIAIDESIVHSYISRCSSIVQEYGFEIGGGED